MRVIIATIAFAMGLDCPDVREIIHWGPSSDVETGRCGRDGLLSTSLLLHGKGDMHNISDSMQNNVNVCRHTLLFSDFDGFGEIKSDVHHVCVVMCVSTVMQDHNNQHTT